MYKTLVIPNNREMLSLESDAFLLGIDGYSVNMPFYIQIEELDEIINSTNKEIFVSINKNIFNDEIDGLKELLLKLNKYNIKGVFYYDISLVNLKKKLNLKYDLVWNQEHLTTNYSTVNYWLNNGVKYACLSSEITIREIKEIMENTHSKLIVPMFGYIPMMNSKRHLVNNYLKEFELENYSGIKYIEKEGNIYPIIEDENGTTVYTDKILNGIKDVLDINVEYILLNSFLIDNDDFEKVLKMFKSVTVEIKQKYYNEINNMFNSDTLFLHKETIYRVKK